MAMDGDLTRFVGSQRPEGSTLHFGQARYRPARPQGSPPKGRQAKPLGPGSQSTSRVWAKPLPVATHMQVFSTPVRYLRPSSA